MIRTDLERAEIFAIAGALIYSAANLSDVAEISPEVQAVMLSANHQAVLLMKKSGLEPTELKNLGVRLLGKVV